MIVLLVGLLVLLGGVQGSVDLTVTESATGRAVVDAVVDIITQSCVFDNDRLMLRRIAYAETRDGADSSTGGGIWQVDKTSFTETRDNLTNDLADAIADKFGIDWKQTLYQDLLKPLYSGIAARLKIAAHYGQANTPQNVSEQASYWATTYTAKSSENATDDYRKASDALTTSCGSPSADVVFVLDGSGSIKIRNFRKVKSFVQDVVEAFDVSNTTVRIGLIEFSRSAEVQFDLQRYSNKEDVKRAVGLIPYFGSGTNSAAGLNSATDMIEQQGRHDDGVPVVVIFLTDGRSNNARLTQLAAINLHTTLPQVTVFAVGVGSRINERELRTIASAPECNHVYFLADFNDVSAFTNQILNGACKAQAEIDESRDISGTLNKDQHYYFKITARKDTNGVRVQVQARSGAVNAFYSWRVENPSEALHDVMVKADAGKGLTSVHIPWSDQAERNADNVTIAGNETTIASPLYGAVVGVNNGPNEFTLSYDTNTDVDSSADVLYTGHLLSVLAAFVVLVRNYF